MWTSFKRIYLPWIIAYLGRFIIWVLMRTCRFEIQGLNEFIKTAKESPCILMLWHNRLATVTSVLQRRAKEFTYTAVISKSRDVDALAALCRSYRNGRVIRVAHNARHQALGAMIHRLNTTKEVMIVTPDGPRGPFHVVKPGIVYAAYNTGAKIIPFAWHADRAWTLKTRDRMVIPKPFAKIKVIFGDPVSIIECNIDIETERLREVMFALHDKLK